MEAMGQHSRELEEQNGGEEDNEHESDWLDIFRVAVDGDDVELLYIRHHVNGTERPADVQLVLVVLQEQDRQHVEGIEEEHGGHHPVSEGLEVLLNLIDLRLVSDFLGREELVNQTVPKLGLLRGEEFLYAALKTWVRKPMGGIGSPAAFVSHDLRFCRKKRLGSLGGVAFLSCMRYNCKYSRDCEEALHIRNTHLNEVTGSMEVLLQQLQT